MGVGIRENWPLAGGYLDWGSSSGLIDRYLLLVSSNFSTIKIKDYYY